MIRYLDTSVLVAALSREARSTAIQRWLQERAPGELKISEWVITEFSAALSIKLRERQIDEDYRAEALARFARLMTTSLEVLPVLGSHYRTAAHFADNYALGLRGGDALHLAIASEHGANLCTLDKRLEKAAAALGAQATLI